MSNGTVYAITFYALAAATLLSALMVVVFRNIVRAALALIATFFFVAWVYLMLSADLLWVAQLLIYAGAIPVLIVFAVMFTRRSMSDSSNQETGNRPWASVVGIAVFALFTGVLLPTAWPTTPWPNPPGTTVIIGQELVRRYAIPFEVVSLLLLVALIGAVVLAHREDDA